MEHRQHNKSKRPIGNHKQNENDSKCNKNSNITVAVRVRPLSYEEGLNSRRVVIKVLNENSILFDPDTDHNNLKSIRGIPNQLKHRDQTFCFDRVFNTYETTTEVFEHTTKQLVETVLEGYNCCCFAYGATGAGKTYTMLGTSSSPGVMVLTMEELFSKINQIKSKIISVSISYLEVYNETIRDLLVENSPKLNMQENAEGEVSIADLTAYYPHSAKEVISLLQKGNARRSQSPTEANLQSSRSHAVFQVTVQQKEPVGTSFFLRTAKLSLIDLAGSEKAQPRSTGMRFMEGANINKSLLALGNCINALGQNSNDYIPFRTSKLTRLLKDSLGGNCKTVMIANISPSELSFEDTKNTLDYSNRAKNIKTNAKQNGAFVKKTKSEMEILRLSKELAELTAKNTVSEIELQRIALYNDQIQSISAIGGKLSGQISSLRNTLYQSMNELDNLWQNESPIEDISKQCVDTKHQINKLLQTVQQHLLRIEEMQDEMDNSLSTSTNKENLQTDIAKVKAQILKIGFLHETPIPSSKTLPPINLTPKNTSEFSLEEPTNTVPVTHNTSLPRVVAAQGTIPPGVSEIPPPMVIINPEPVHSHTMASVPILPPNTNMSNEENFKGNVNNDKPRMSLGRDNIKIQRKIKKNKLPRVRKSMAVTTNNHTAHGLGLAPQAKRNQLYRPSLCGPRPSIASRKSIIPRQSIGQNISKIQPRKSLGQMDICNQENIPLRQIDNMPPSLKVQPVVEPVTVYCKREAITEVEENDTKGTNT